MLQHRTHLAVASRHVVRDGSRTGVETAADPREHWNYVHGLMQANGPGGLVMLADPAAKAAILPQIAQPAVSTVQSRRRKGTSP